MARSYTGYCEPLLSGLFVRHPDTKCHSHHRGLPGTLTWLIGRLLPQAMTPAAQTRLVRMLPLTEPPIPFHTQGGYTV